ncbi:hypothetical protein [Streptomyces sp. NPDC002671]
MMAREHPPSNRLVKHAWLTEAIVGELGLGLSVHVSHGTVELLLQRAGLYGLAWWREGFEQLDTE